MFLHVTGEEAMTRDFQEGEDDNIQLLKKEFQEKKHTKCACSSQVHKDHQR